MKHVDEYVCPVLSYAWIICIPLTKTWNPTDVVGYPEMHTSIGLPVELGYGVPGDLVEVTFCQVCLDPMPSPLQLPDWQCA